MITVLGASGFIGSHLTRHLDSLRVPWQAPARDEDLRGRELGHVIDCAGITADFRTRLADTVDAHVCRILGLVRDCMFESFLYLSSPRLYKDRPSTQEDDDIHVSPIGADGLYNLSKVMGESIVLNLGDRGRVARLSNVYGHGSEAHNFLASILADAVATGEIVLGTSLDSAKDYVSVGDVVALLYKIATEGRRRIYNVASGVNVTNGEITTEIARLTGCRVSVKPNAETRVYPPIDIGRAREELGFRPARLVDDLPMLVRQEVPR